MKLRIIVANALRPGNACPPLSDAVVASLLLRHQHNADYLAALGVLRGNDLAADPLIARYGGTTPFASASMSAGVTGAVPARRDCAHARPTPTRWEAASTTVVVTNRRLSLFISCPLQL